MNPLISDILGQPDSLQRLLAYHSGDGLDSLSRAAAEIRHAHRVIFSGMGSSLFASMTAVGALAAQGRAAFAIDAAEMLYYYRAFGRDTLAVLVSRSGETVEVIKLISILREQGVHIVGVTNVAGSTLAKQADVSILVNSDPDHLVALRTYTGTAATLLMLASRACDRTETAPANLPDLMRAEIEREMEAPPFEWNPHSRIYVLGRGPSLGSVYEGALLFHETARTPAVPMSCAQFRHGPVEAVTPDLVAFVFTSQPETHDLDERLAEDLIDLGARVRAISFPISGPWAAVLDVIPIQIAAVRLAEARGVPPASFQFAPMVTVDETGFRNPATRT